ncbi:alcohol dehydrogenase AdhP [Sediminivirga luteola]|uniref:Alcohol dehydrogenase n=1 Tax=Sediminivirga luteola TaxID=1774748 RepID=A0A8J2TWA2_9MICO|nr:alcohol dehydrogenase AdhP [Sediminivirga luteola]MCI2265698.1 alcohol dehydrogenase AdhP [Sediminivirga luteola]GGA07336.1 zinc-dependent alcohol dehydrogenase [Sediminivirga luteola]
MAAMKAAVVEEFGNPLRVTADVPVPEPGEGQLLVKLVSSGVCHTDLHAAEGDWPVKPSPPFIPGHEGVGRVEKVGPGVSGYAEGDLVGNAWLWSACGQCEYCRTGWETLCESQQNGGYSVDGSFGEYMLVDAGYAARIPEGADPYEVAPVLCAGVTVYKGLKQTEVRPGQWVAISGIGGLGHVAVQYAVAMGMRVVAVDVADDKLALARRHGAEVTVNAFGQDPAEAVQEATGGVHGVLVTAVHPAAFGQAIGMTRRGATIVFNGLPPGDFPAPIFDIVLRGLTIRGSIVGTRQDMVEALEFYAEGKIHPTVSTRPLEDINAVFDEMRHGKIDGRVVIEY